MDKKKKNTMIISVIALALILVGVSYAFFSSNISYVNKTNTKLISNKNNQSNSIIPFNENFLKNKDKYQIIPLSDNEHYHIICDKKRLHSQINGKLDMVLNHLEDNLQLFPKWYSYLLLKHLLQEAD